MCPGVFSILGHNRRSDDRVHRGRTRQKIPDFIHTVDLFRLLHTDRTDRRLLDGFATDNFLDAVDTISHHHLRIVVWDSADNVDITH